MSSKTESTPRVSRALCNLCHYNRLKDIDDPSEKWDVDCRKTSALMRINHDWVLPPKCPYRGLTHEQALIQIMIDKLENPTCE